MINKIASSIAEALAGVKDGSTVMIGGFGTAGIPNELIEYTFDEHDETIAYSLSIPFASTLVFASVMKPQEAPGTTFKRHMDIAKGLLSEDDYLLSEILFNPNTPKQVENIRAELKLLLEIIENKDTVRMHEFLKKVRKNIE